VSISSDQEPQKKVTDLFHLAIKANAIVYGHDVVVRYMQKKKIYLLIITEDLSSKSIKSVQNRNFKHCIEIVQWGKKSFFQKLFGKEVGIIGITNKNFSLGLRKLLTIPFR